MYTVFVNEVAVKTFDTWEEADKWAWDNLEDFVIRYIQKGSTN